MEHHRLKPMKDGYDEKLFNELYKKTTPLRRKLAYQIDARKFGVDYQEILSWFDVKFIHAFNKYYDLGYNGVLAHIINSLSTYKCRIMRSSYQAKYHNHAHILDITEVYNYSDSDETEDSGIIDDYLNTVMVFMKSKLHDDAILVMEIELCPPPYIIDNMKDLGRKETQKIPNDLIADYLGWGSSENCISYIKDLRQDIRYVTNLAKKFFNSDNQLTTA